MCCTLNVSVTLSTKDPICSDYEFSLQGERLTPLMYLLPPQCFSGVNSLRPIRFWATDRAFLLSLYSWEFPVFH